MLAKIQRGASLVASMVLVGAWACAEYVGVGEQQAQELGVHQAALIVGKKVEPAVKLPSSVDEKEVGAALARIDFPCGVDPDGEQHAKNRSIVADLLSKYAPGDLLDAVLNIQARTGDAFRTVLFVISETAAAHGPEIEALLIERFSKADDIASNAVEQDGQPVPPEHARANSKHLQVQIVQALARSTSDAARGLLEAASRSAPPRVQEAANIALGRVPQ